METRRAAQQREVDRLPVDPDTPGFNEGRATEILQTNEATKAWTSCGMCSFKSKYCTWKHLEFAAFI